MVAELQGARHRRGGPLGSLTRLIARPEVQGWVGRIPLLRRLARRDGAGIFDVLQGFVASQVLLALVEMDLLAALLEEPATADDLGRRCDLPAERMEVLLAAGAALRLLKARRDGRYALARRGAAILGVPGLTDMIRHDRLFYRDMADPVALLRGGGETELARFWPYVMGAADAGAAARYSDLMARSQALVAEDTLQAVSLRGTRHLLDVGGGSGVFAAAALRRHPDLRATVFDLPSVIPRTRETMAREGLSARADVHAGSFREDALPQGADAISLIRVLYDHDDRTVAALLARVHAALPAGGRLIVSEPMSGGARPEPAGDVYFAFYTMAMGTGRVRSARRIAELCAAAGFDIKALPTPARPFVTSVASFVRRG